jgi:hypothetical protein
VVRGVDLGGSLGADERCCLAGAIHFVTGSDRVCLSLFSATSGACGLGQRQGKNGKQPRGR